MFISERKKCIFCRKNLYLLYCNHLTLFLILSFLEQKNKFVELFFNNIILGAGCEHCNGIYLFNRGVYMSTKAAFNEDKVALVCGLFIFVLALGKLIGLDILG